MILPKPCSPSGPRVVMLRPGSYDTSKYTIMDSMLLSNMISDMLLNDDDHTTVAGTRFIVDLKGVTMGHFTQMTPTTIKKMVMSGQVIFSFTSPTPFQIINNGLNISKTSL